MTIVEEKEFPLSVILTLLTAKSFGDKFSDIDEAIEFVIGHPVWIHEMTDMLLWEQIQENIIEQYPEFKLIDGNLINADNVFKYKEQYEKEFGSTKILKRGTEVRHKSPIETAQELLPDKKIIQINI